MRDERTVFVVDDDPAAAASVEALMLSEGLNAECYSSAEEFLENIDGRTGCLVVDVRLQGMSGLDLLAALAKDDGLPMPVIVISGHADNATSEVALEHGAMACLEKPFDSNHLCELVHAAVPPW